MEHHGGPTPESGTTGAEPDAPVVDRPPVEGEREGAPETSEVGLGTGTSDPGMADQPVEGGLAEAENDEGAA